MVGIAYFMASPVMVGALVKHAGFSEQQAGLLAAIEAGGSFIASILVSLTVNRFDRRRIATVAIFIAIVANLAMSQAEEFYPTAACRSLSGIGSGALYALGLASLAASHRTSRNFSILLFVQVSFGMLGINLFDWLAEQAGMDGIYLSMAFAFAMCLVFVNWLPRYTPQHEANADNSPLGDVHGLLPWVCLFAVFLFYIGIGAFWTYIERIGISGGLDPALVIDSLTYTQVLSLLGCVIAGWFSHKLGQFRPLIASLICAAGANYSLTIDISSVSFIAALCIFFLFWNAIDIYQLGTLGNMNHGGRFVALVPAFQTTATALGPALSALLLSTDGHYAPVLLMSGTTTLTAALLYFFVYKHCRGLFQLPVTA